MNRIVLTGLIISVLSFQAHANPPLVNDVACNGIRAVKQHIDELLKTYKPQDIGIICDNDGVINNQTDPVPQPAKPRGDMVNVIRDWNEKGLFMIVSSASEDYNGTLDKLRTVGLSETLGLSSQKEVQPQGETGTTKHTDYNIFNSDTAHSQALESAKKEAQSLYNPQTASTQSSEEPYSIDREEMLTQLIMSNTYGTQIDYQKTGRVISARQNPAPKIYNRAKYFALDYADRGGIPPFKIVVLIDDKKTIIDIFKEHMHRTKWYQTVQQIHLLNVPQIHGERNEADFLTSKTTTEPSIN